MRHLSSLIKIVQFYEQSLKRPSRAGDNFPNLCYFLNKFHGDEWKEFFMAQGRPLALYHGPIYKLELAQLCGMYPTVELVPKSHYGVRILEGAVSVNGVSVKDKIIRPYHRTRQFETCGGTTMMRTLGRYDSTALIVHYIKK